MRSFWYNICLKGNMKNLLIVFFSLTLLNGIAQDEKIGQTVSDSLLTDSLVKDSIVVRKPLKPGAVVEYVDSFYYATEALQKKINFTKCPELINGYRVQLFSCSGEGCPKKAAKYYNQFLIAYPNIPVYKLWQPPTLKVRAGDCRSRFDAEKIKNEIKDDFPFVFIVPGHIDSPYKIDCESMSISESDSLLIAPLRKK